MIEIFCLHFALTTSAETYQSKPLSRTLHEINLKYPFNTKGQEFRVALTFLMAQLLAFSSPFCAEKLKPEKQNYAETVRLCSFCQKVPRTKPPSAYIIENDKDGIPIIWKQMVRFFWIFITIKNIFCLHSPGGWRGVKTLVLMKLHGDLINGVFCLSQVGGKCWESTV